MKEILKLEIGIYIMKARDLPIRLANYRLRILNLAEDLETPAIYISTSF